MQLHRIALIGSEEVAEGTRAFHFTKPAGFAFAPGQFANFSLLDPAETDAAGMQRSFSIASAPWESEIMIATRMRPSAFKRTLAALPAGTSLEMDGPYGELVQEDDGRRAVFLAGGIGITPFLSMLRDAAHHGKDRAITLVYGNRTPEASAFLAELDALAGRLPGLRLVNCMSEPEKSARGWTGETGFVDDKLLARHIADPPGATWYVVGPPGMTAAMRDVLLNLGVDDGAVRVEDFAGY
jgi:ferredoxin-NADP reductase